MEELDSAQVRVNEILATRNAASVQSSVQKAKPPKPKRVRNLKPAWEPGQSGNPAGKAPGTISLKAILRTRLAEVPEGAGRRTLAELVVDEVCRSCLRGDAQARRLVWESIDGPARIGVDVTAHQEVDHTSAAERLEAALAQMRGRIHEEMTEAEREAEEVKIDADYDAIQKALAAADPRRYEHKLELYASYANESIRMTGCYCDRTDCSSRRDEAG
jgi:hypothetical protein